jgi:hypothetical protein
VKNRMNAFSSFPVRYHACKYLLIELQVQVTTSIMTGVCEWCNTACNIHAVQRQCCCSWLMCCAYRNTASNLSGLMTSPFWVNQMWTATRQLSRLPTTLVDDYFRQSNVELCVVCILIQHHIEFLSDLGNWGNVCNKEHKWAHFHAARHTNS